MPTILVHSSGQEHSIEAEVGISLMEAIVQSGLDMEAICGGCLSCATCHVHVHLDDMGKFPPCEEDESDMLDLADNVTESSRLSCQLKITDAHDGLRVSIVEG